MPNIFFHFCFCLWIETMFYCPRSVCVCRSAEFTDWTELEETEQFDSAAMSARRQSGVFRLNYLCRKIRLWIVFDIFSSFLFFALRLCVCCGYEDANSFISEPSSSSSPSSMGRRQSIIIQLEGNKTTTATTRQHRPFLIDSVSITN